MVGTRALGLVCSDPQRGHLALHELAALVDLPDGADALGVAAIVDGAALLSRFPALPAGSRLAHVVGPFQGRCAVVQVRVRNELRPSGSDGTSDLGPFRARTFAAAIAGGPQDPDAASLGRERLLADVPDFLRRFMGGRSESEALFLAILARLHHHGVIDSAQAPAEVLATACREALERAAGGPRHVVLTNGADMVHVAAGMPSALISLHGLSEDVAARLDPTFTDSSMARERLRRFRGVLCIGGLDAAMKAATPMPPGASLQVLPDVAAIAVNRNFDIRVL